MRSAILPFAASFPAALLALAALPLALAGCQENKVGVFNTPPNASIVSPPDGTSVAGGSLVEFWGLVGDDQTDPADLTVLWNSSLDGDLDSTPADVDGSLYFSTATLTEGDHSITLTAVDPSGESASTAILLRVGEGGGGSVSGPTVTILGPAEGETFTFSQAVNLIAAVTDVEDAEETLQVELIDVPDGSLWTGNPTSTGSLTVPLTLTPGGHTVTVNARDADGNVGTGSVSFSIEGDGRPSAVITAPADGMTYSTEDTITFRGTVSDADTDIEDIGVTWSSDVSGVFSTNPPDSSGATSIGTRLIAGVHTVTLTAVDDLAQTGADSIVVTVVDPRDIDDDGDGFTENGGDCDDTDGGVYPRAAEQCDSVDNDCDGDINEDWWDSFEANDARWGYDVGEVDDGFLWAGATLTLSGITLSTADDEDWFYWYADDEIYDNVSISVTATGFPASGDYVMELWSIDEGRYVDSDSGSASLTVSYSGDWLDDGEDNWAIRIYAASWPRNTCSTTITVTIHS